MTALLSRVPAALWPLVVVVLASACTLGVAENAAGGGAVGSGFRGPLIDTAEREQAPAVCAVTVAADDELCVESLAGTPTVVNFWASWCGPCAREMPELIALDTEYGEAVSFLGVNTDDTRTNARSFERDQDVTYPSLFDEGAVIASQFGGIAPDALPSTFLLDAEHRVAHRLFGAVSAAELRPFLDDLIAESP